uniref:BLOC-1-related complex subunit 7 n=1 Tax=Loxodonta africana TaxID=9785 RepID=G3UA88_LOXAF
MALTTTPFIQRMFVQALKDILTAEKVNVCGTDVIVLIKGSWNSELLRQVARNIVLQEDAILHSEESLREMAVTTTHLHCQQEAVKNVQRSSDLQDQLKHLLK